MGQQTESQGAAPKGDVPHGMVEVSREDFWARVMAERRNVHPSPERYSTNWMIVGTSNRWGWSSRGFCGPFDYQGAHPEVFALSEQQS